jgi:hypothetical protein
VRGPVAGGFFEMAAMDFRAASVSFHDLSPFVAAAFTLVIAASLQPAGMVGDLATRERGQIGRVFANPRAG